nr:hypothetical protein [Tanacetum cinerariifolium]
MGVIDIETLTLEQYLGLEGGTTNRKERNLKDENFEIKAVLQKELPPKVKDPESFILPSRKSKAIKMMIEMADRSMQSPKGRPMLATTHAKIEVFEKKISLKVGTKQVVFNANNGTSPLTILLVFVKNDYQVIDDLGGPEDLEEVLMNEDINGDLGNFLKENRILPNFDHQEAISFSPSSSLEIAKDSFRTSQDSNNDMSIGNFEIDDL